MGQCLIGLRFRTFASKIAVLIALLQEKLCLIGVFLTSHADIIVKKSNIALEANCSNDLRTAL